MTDLSEYLGYAGYLAGGLIVVALALASLRLVPGRRTLLLCAVSALTIVWWLYWFTRDVTISTPYDDHTYCANLMTAESGVGDSACRDAQLRHDLIANVPMALGSAVLLHGLIVGALRRRK